VSVRQAGEPQRQANAEPFAVRLGEQRRDAHLAAVLDGDEAAVERRVRD
jgi:hypothetical protein